MRLSVGASRSAATIKKKAGALAGGTAMRMRTFAASIAKSRTRARLLAGDRVVVPIAFMRRIRVATRHQIPGEKLAVIPRRIDGARFDPPAISPERATVLRRGWKIGRGQRVILVPGRIDPAKGQAHAGRDRAHPHQWRTARRDLRARGGDNRQHSITPSGLPSRPKRMASRI